MLAPVEVAYLIGLEKSGPKKLWRVTNQSLNEDSVQKRSKAPEKEYVGKQIPLSEHTSNNFNV